MIEVRLGINAELAPATIVRDIAAVVERFPGHSPIYLHCASVDGDKTLLLRQKVDYTAEFYLAVRELGVDLQIR